MRSGDTGLFNLITMSYKLSEGYLYVTSDNGITIQKSKELVSDDYNKLIEEIEKQINEGTLVENVDGKILGGVVYIETKPGVPVYTLVEVGKLDENQLEEVYSHYFRNY